MKAVSFFVLSTLACLSLTLSASADDPVFKYDVDDHRYREASGGSKGNIQCFEGWSLEQAKAECNRLSNCAGFSYGRADGANAMSGCLKNNHDAGWNTNSNYDGYTKAYKITSRGYREAAGGAAGNIQCFERWTLEQAQQECNKNKLCVGFSFGRADGKNSGNGCLKNNYDGGFNNNSDYSGYEKIATP